MEPSTVLLFFLPLTLCIALHSGYAAAAPAAIPAPGPAAGDLIAKACEFSAHKDLCSNVLHSNPESHKAKDLSSLAFIAIKQASSNATKIASDIATMLKNENLEPATQQCLSECLEHYTDAADQLQASVAAAAGKGYGGVKTWVLAAVADSESCDNEFKDLGTNKLVLAHPNRVFRQLCGNALSIVKHFA